MKKFKAELKAPYAFVPDPDAKLVSLYDVKAPVVKIASRTTFVIGPDRKVIAIQSGGDAIDPGGAIKACSLKKPAADGGTQARGPGAKVARRPRQYRLDSALHRSRIHRRR